MQSLDHEKDSMSQHDTAGGLVYTVASGTRQGASKLLMLLNLHGSHSLATLPGLQLLGLNLHPVPHQWLAPGFA